MARLSDHDRRDAEHALRSEITLAIARYVRRMADKGNALITEALAQAVKEGKGFDGSSIGKTVAKRVLADYFTTGKPQGAIDVAASASACSGSSGAENWNGLSS